MNTVGPRVRGPRIARKPPGPRRNSARQGAYIALIAYLSLMHMIYRYVVVWYEYLYWLIVVNEYLVQAMSSAPLVTSSVVLVDSSSSVPWCTGSVLRLVFRSKCWELAVSVAGAAFRWTTYRECARVLGTAAVVLCTLRTGLGLVVETSIKTWKSSPVGRTGSHHDYTCARKREGTSLSTININTIINGT